MPGESVSIGFNGHGGSGDDIPIDFVVASKKIGNDINVDDELVKSVYSKLQIGFAEGDSCLAVTNNIELPQNIDGADIEWVTDNEAVISKEGYVTRDYNETKCIKLVAKISKNETILNKEFEVRVIKSMYEDYSIDDIIILDEFEQLYFYNDIIEDLQIFKNKLGYLDFVIGSISDIQVECFNEARLAIYGIKDLVGIDSIDEELKCEGIDKDESGYVYKFTQVYNGIPIYGSVITLLTDLDGNVVGFNSSYIPININTTADVSGENALNKSGIEYQEFKSAELVIYIDDAEPKLSWNITYTNSSGNSCNAVVDANTAEPYIVNPLSSQIAASGKDENGIKRDFNVEYDSDEEFYVMHDYRRDITVYDLNNNINAGEYRDNEIRQINPPINSYSNDWSDDSIAVGTYVNAIKCFDYYKDTFGRNGFFLAARPIDLYINWNNYNAEYNTSTKRNLVFGKPVDDAKSWGASLQTVAHEYTHGIIDAMTDLDKNYISEAGAINEAYADAMSMIISNNTTWQVRLPKGELERDCITPSNSECPSVYSKCIEYDPDSKGTHKNSTVLSHAFYFMNSRGIGNSRLARLLYKSLLISYSEYARFTDVRKNCLYD